MNPYHARCGEIDFQAREGEECLASNVSMLLEKIRVKYLEYGIKDTPYVAVKADAGTYGMGVMMVRDAAEVRDLNRKQRNKMAVVKEGLAVTDVIIQEGVHTVERNRGKSRRAGGLHARPLRHRRLLPRARRARRGREPERAGDAFRAARLRPVLLGARSARQLRRAAEPLLCLRRGGAPALAAAGLELEKTAPEQERA